MKMRLAVLALWMVFSSLHAQAGDPWKKLDFLLGEWIGVAGGKDTPLGAGQGSFSFRAELNGRIIVRRNQANYDSGARHDDLMVVYADAPHEMPRAIYFDSEGHVIRYTLAFPAPDRVVFETEAAPAAPQYRLTYWLEGGSLKGRFEVRAPASEYKVYLSWASKKR